MSEGLIVIGANNSRSLNTLSSITTERIDRGLPPCYFLMTRNRTNLDAHMQTNCGAVYDLLKPYISKFYTITS
ncbi:hypothetical protein CEXT_51861 [Caerostris extrusa]|uniref:Uncharacterized protein n=1 Tax=Caerostris extrusa TaxID=172846 RepID=A0AAV4Y6K2_CAEEX|nr:hypothetical protein CEXT_51861 [Caerostris extrusa]